MDVRSFSGCAWLAAAALLLAATRGCVQDPAELDAEQARIAAESKLNESSSPRPPDAPTLLHQAVVVLSTRAYGRQRLDWPAVQREVGAGLKAGDPPASAHAAIAAATARLGDPHARFIPAQPPVTQAAQQPKAGKPAAPAPKQPEIPTSPQVTMLPDGCAYLIVPGCNAPDAEGLRAYARQARAAIAVGQAAGARAWVIDLRLNGGGNLWPMLLGLAPLLDSGVQMTMVGAEGKESDFGVSDAWAWIDWGKGPEMQLDWAGSPPTPAAKVNGRVAVLIGPWTMSSGEALAICLSGRSGVRTFGEPTAGLTTVTNTFPLSDGSVLNLPVSAMGDRAGRVVAGKVQPDVAAAFDDWPSATDAAAKAARAWALEGAAGGGK